MSKGRVLLGLGLLLGCVALAPQEASSQSMDRIMSHFYAEGAVIFSGRFVSVDPERAILNWGVSPHRFCEVHFVSGRFELDEEGCLEVYRTLYRDGVTVNGAPFDRVESGHAYLLSARVNTLGVIGATSVIGGHLALQPEFDAFFVSSASGFMSRKLWSGEGDVYFSTDRRAEGDEPVLQEALELLMQAYIAKRHVKHKDPVKYVSADVVIDPELCAKSLLRTEFEHNGKTFIVSIPGEFAEGYSRVYRPWTDVCPEHPGQQTAKLYRMDGDRMEPQLLSSAYVKITRLDSAWSVTLEGAAPSPWTGALTLSVSANLACVLQRVSCPEWGELDVSPAVQLKEGRAVCVVEGEPCAR